MRPLTEVTTEAVETAFKSGRRSPEVETAPLTEATTQDEEEEEEEAAGASESGDQSQRVEAAPPLTEAMIEAVETAFESGRRSPEVETAPLTEATTQEKKKKKKKKPRGLPKVEISLNESRRCVL